MTRICSKSSPSLSMQACGALNRHALTLRCGVLALGLVLGAGIAPTVHAQLYFPSACTVGTQGTGASGEISIAGGGVCSHAGGQNDIAIGTGASSNGTSATALGWSANASANLSTAMGESANASGVAALAVGATSTASGASAMAMGNAANAIGVNSIAIGTSASAVTTADTALGVNAVANSTSLPGGGSATAIGSNAQATVSGTTAVGNLALANGQYATALGEGASATFVATAVGALAQAQAQGAVSIGANTTAAGGAAVAVGWHATANANGVAVGYGTTTSVDGTAIGNASQALGGWTVAIGNGDTVAGGAGVGSFAGGYLSQVTGGAGAVAIGNQQTANGNGAVAIGDPNSATGIGAVAIGAGNVATGDGAIALGDANTANGAGAVALGNASSAAAVSALALGNAANASQVQSIALGAGATASAQAGDVALGSGSVTATVVNTSSATVGGVTYAGFAGTTAASTVSVGNAGSPRTITHLAAGQISAVSTDAVNGSELYSVANTLGSQVMNLGNSVASSFGGGSSYDASTGTVTTNLSYGGNSYNSVQSVLNQIGSAVGGGGIKYFHANSSLADAQAGGSNSVAVGPTANAGSADAVALGHGATARANTGDVALGAGSMTSTVVSTGSVTVGGHSYAVAGATPTSTVSVGSVGNERTVTNVAAGQVSATSTDAVNGSELYATNQQVTANTTAISNLNANVSNLYSGGNKYYAVDSTGTAATATGTNAVAEGTSASATGSNALAEGTSSSAAGTDSTAIGVDAAVSGNNSVALGTNSTDGGRSNVVSVGSSSNQRQLVDVAAGTAATDAVNVAQLDAAEAGDVQYDKNSNGSINTSSITVGQAGAPAQIHNLAAGTVASDAANVGQVDAGVQQAENWAQRYTDQKVAAIDQDLNALAARANAGVAAGIAMASLGQAYQPNLSSVGVGVGSYRGEAGVAIGVSTITESGRYIFKLAASSDTRGDVGVGGSFNVVW